MLAENLLYSTVLAWHIFVPALFCAICADCAVYPVITVPTYNLHENVVLCVSKCVQFVPFVLLASSFSCLCCLLCHLLCSEK